MHNRQAFTSRPVILVMVLVLSLAAKAQDFVALSTDRNGENEMSFSLLSRMPDAMVRLGCPSSNAHGDFFVRKSDNPACLQIIGVGIEAGNDKRHPLRMMMKVYANRTLLTVLN